MLEELDCMVRGVRNLIFTDDFKFYFSAQLSHFHLFKFLFSQSHIIETRQTFIQTSTDTMVITICTSTIAYLRRTLLVHIVAKVLHLRIDARYAQVPELNIQSPLSHLRRNNLQGNRLLGDPTTPVLLRLDHLKIPQYPLKMTNNAGQTIRVDHQCQQLELV